MTKTLAASFIVTATLLSACTAGQHHPDNPPVTIAKNAPPPDSPPPATPPANALAERSSLPAANQGDKVVAKPDGTCWAYPKQDCPPSPVTCEMAAPTQVQCPDE